MGFDLVNRKTFFCVEQEAWEGVRRIARVVAADVAAVGGALPAQVQQPRDGQTVLCATLGRSPLAERLLRRGVLNPGLPGKREVYQICFADLDGRETLVICGSDKRGTIYGMFALSEYLGVSPLCDWGDATPRRRETVTVERDIETLSREPSVRYRGFFINDEWPCFGTWATSHYAGVNADCYERVFLLLLRMKGNYLWPAMWRSSFPLDGPGSANEELADIYGVIMGYSHHEPCLRASEEWDLVRGEDSPYGNAWNYYTNEAGLNRYWHDALLRSGGYENIITIGMRGERDTSMLGEKATLEENISLLKRIILAQRSMIRELVPRQAVQLLALYKEVERYFHGDENTEGLKHWRELDDVLFLLCEDNFGHLRTLPPADLREHPGGWGMYYHLDYHGSPVSYEWVDSTPLAQIWEQMTQAWEYGIRDLWIVNVGDLKFHEVPLSYFLALAWDFDRWGSGNLNSPREYTLQWAGQCFPSASDSLRREIAGVFRDCLFLNSLRRPEALHAGVYHPCHHRETDRMLALAEQLETRSETLYRTLEEKDAYYSMVHYPAMASANLLKLQLLAGKNHLLAAQGKLGANRLAAEATQCILRDRTLAEEFAAFRDGKWSGMQLAPHVGFTEWNEDDCRYPPLCHQTAMDKIIMKVGRADSTRYGAKKYGPPAVIRAEDFLYPGITEILLEIAAGGRPFDYTVTARDALPRWLTVENAAGRVEEQGEILLRCDRSLLPREKETCTLTVTDGDAVVEIAVAGQADRTEGLPPMTFLPRDGVLAIPAWGFAEKTDVPGGAFRCISDYGRYGKGMKVMPSTARFAPEEAAPELQYRFRIDEAGLYRIEVLTAPLNPTEPGQEVRMKVTTDGEPRILTLIDSSFRAGESSDETWAQGVMEQIHRAALTVPLEQGLHTLTLGALEPGVVTERIVISGGPLPESYLGPETSFCTSELPPCPLTPF